MSSFWHLSALLICLILVCEGKIDYIEIDTFATDTPVTTQTAENFAFLYSWYAPYYVTGYSQGTPMLFQDLTPDAIGGSREIVIGYRRESSDTAKTTSDVTNGILTSKFDPAFSGTAYYQWDGSTVNYWVDPQDFEIFPGLTPTTFIPESNQLGIDFTSFGRATGLTFTFFPNQLLVFYVDVADNNGGINTFTKVHTGPFNEYTEYYISFDDPGWSCVCGEVPVFNWQTVTAVQFRIVKEPVAFTVITKLGAFSVSGFGISGIVNRACGCDPENTEPVAFEQLNLFLEPDL